jgi:hypothetical protein
MSGSEISVSTLSCPVLIASVMCLPHEVRAQQAPSEEGGFIENLQFRPVFELGLGELTTLLGINLDVVYMFPGFTRETRWSR